MLYQNLITSDDQRLGKKVIVEQKKSNEEGWYKQTERIASELGIDIERAEKDTKAVWKKELKKLIEEKMDKELEEKAQQYRKMRHQIGQKFERKKYLTEMGIEEAVTTLRRRLEMVDTGNNLRNNKKCKKCDERYYRTYDRMQRQQ